MSEEKKNLPEEELKKQIDEMSDEELDKVAGGVTLIDVRTTPVKTYKKLGTIRAFITYEECDYIPNIIYPIAEVSSNLLEPFDGCDFLGFTGTPQFLIKRNWDTVDQVKIYRPGRWEWDHGSRKMTINVFEADW